jgi:peptidoglycan/LPS O-acetylase OafA/YrhL
MRDKILDGFRAVAVSCVVLSHAASYRWGDVVQLHYLRRASGSLAEVGVQIFFVISGLIITSLLLREEAKGHGVSVAAFYARRTLRILPLFLLMVALSSADAASKAHAVTFTCNFAECAWGVAHSWSLAVEEQYYLAWPLLFIILRNHRTTFLVTTIVTLLCIYVLRPFTYHANALSFACIAVGALLAVQPTWRLKGRWLPWISSGTVLLVGPLFAEKATSLVTPFLVAYLITAASDLRLVGRLLSSPPFQWIGLASYSLYLWQQPFLAKSSSLPIYLLPLVVVASVYFVERPFIRLGHRLSATIASRTKAKLGHSPLDRRDPTAKA